VSFLHRAGFLMYKQLARRDDLWGRLQSAAGFSRLLFADADSPSIRKSPALLCVLLLLCAGRAEIIDRVAVVVGNGVITESEILREVRLTAFLNGAPVDFSAASKRKTAERLVEQRLIRNDMDSSLYPLPNPEDVDQMAKDLQSRFGSRARYEQELQRAG